MQTPVKRIKINPAVRTAMTPFLGILEDCDAVEKYTKLRRSDAQDKLVILLTRNYPEIKKGWKVDWKTLELYKESFLDKVRKLWT